MSYVYKRTEPQLWTVGYYTPAGSWESESDHDTPHDAAQRVAFLNGGTPGDPRAFPTEPRERTIARRLRQLGFRTVESAESAISDCRATCADGHFDCCQTDGGRCLGEVAAIVAELDGPDLAQLVRVELDLWSTTAGPGGIARHLTQPTPSRGVGS